LDLFGIITKNNSEETSMDIKKITIDIQKLPMLIELKINGMVKDYVIKANKNKTGIFMNKKESY